MKIPEKIIDVFSKEDFKNLLSVFSENKVSGFNFDQHFSRHLADQNAVKELQFYSESLTDLAREIFGSSTLLPTYTLFSQYSGENAKLTKHKDDNACTYTIDFCLYQNYAWDLWVEGNPYTLFPNEALAYYGNEQEHWRNNFPMPKKNKVAMIFFHFAESDHWYFTKGPSYSEVVRNKITEEQWQEIQDRKKL